MKHAHGFIPNKTDFIPPSVNAWKKLVNPKIAPSTAPARGPNVIAPIATGTHKKLTFNIGVLNCPSGVNAITNTTADKNAKFVKYFVF